MNIDKFKSIIGNDVADAVTQVLAGFECSEDFVWYLGKTISEDKVVAGVWATFLGLMEEEWEHLEDRIEELEARLATLEADKTA